MFNRDTVRRSWKAAALTVALPLVLASPAAALAGQQSDGQAARSAATTANVAQVSAPLSQAAISSSPFDAGCGLLPPKCTVRLNRPMTRRARDAAQVAGPIAAGVCAAVPVPAVGAICAAAIAAAAQAFATAASNYYEDGDCLALNILPTPPTPIATPSRVKHGEHNCS
jgi:hypothetical protein